MWCNIIARHLESIIAVVDWFDCDAASCGNEVATLDCGALSVAEHSGHAVLFLIRFDCNAASSRKRVATRASGVPSVERRLRHFVFGAIAYSFGVLLFREHAATCNHRILELGKQRISCLSNVESFGCNG